MVAPANLNSPDQTVISGATAAVERAAALCKEAGAKRTVMLPVSAPFHCRMMEPAAERLAADLERAVFLDPTLPVASNVDARIVCRRALPSSASRGPIWTMRRSGRCWSSMCTGWRGGPGCPGRP